jgi:hypothetical protein
VSRFVPLVLVGLLVSGLLIGAASAGKPRFETKLSYSNEVDGLDFVHKGKVRSDQRACEKDRKVRLFAEEVKGSLGEDRSNRKGKYRIVLKADSIATDYYTTTRKVEKPGFICKRGESKHKGF